MLWEFYAILGLRNKLARGQAYIRPRRTSKNPPRGDFPEGTRSQTVDILLTINDYWICRAHRYVIGSQEVTGPDPKQIRIDDLEFALYRRA